MAEPLIAAPGMACERRDRPCGGVPRGAGEIDFTLQNTSGDRVDEVEASSCGVDRSEARPDRERLYAGKASRRDVRELRREL